MADPPTSAPRHAPGLGARVLDELAHELRGNAGATDIWLELLERAATPAERERAVAEIRRSVAVAVRLAENLADAARLLDGAADRKAVPFDLGAALGQALARAEPEARARKVSFALADPGVFAHPLVADAGGWERTLDRILAAALVHATSGEALAVRMTAAADGVEIAVACGGLELPPDLPLAEAWEQPRPPGRAFPLGLYLARAFLAHAGSRLALRDEAGARWLVLVTA